MNLAQRSIGKLELKSSPC